MDCQLIFDNHSALWSDDSPSYNSPYPFPNELIQADRDSLSEGGSQIPTEVVNDQERSKEAKIFINCTCVWKCIDFLSVACDDAGFIENSDSTTGGTYEGVGADNAEEIRIIRAAVG